MVAISTAFTDLTYAFGSLLTSTKMTQLMDNTTFNNEWIGASYVGAAIQDHDHDGVNSKAFVIPAGTITETELAANAVGQSELKDALQQSTLGASGSYTFTGGPYTLGWGCAGYTSQYTMVPHVTDAYTAGIGITGGSGTNYFQARYFTASAPYNLGNGDIPLFCFVLLDSSGNIEGTYSAEAPPWVYNGRPENTFDPKKYKRKKGKDNFFYDRLVMPDKATNFAMYLDALENPQNYIEEIEITPSMKNLDMDIIPHPFRDDITGKSVILIDPIGSMTEKMRDLHDMGESLGDLLRDGYLLIDNEDLTANKPAGVNIHKVKWK